MSLVLAESRLHNKGWNGISVVARSLESEFSSKLNQGCGVQVNDCLEGSGFGVLLERSGLTVDELEQGREDIVPRRDGNDVLRNLVVGEGIILGDGLDKFEVLGADHGASQADNIIGNGGRHEHGLANLLIGLGEVADDLIQLPLETDIEHTISLIQDKGGQVRGIDAASAILE